MARKVVGVGSVGTRAWVVLFLGADAERLMQASSDIFLGWNRGPAVDGTARDFYVRQLWDGKLSTDVEGAPLATMVALGQLCGPQ